GPERPMRTFEIKNRQVKEVLELLRGLLDAGVLNQPITPATAVRGSEAVQGATAPIAGPVRASLGSAAGPAQEVLLSADEPTGRILAVGEGRLLAQIAQLIETLDVRHPHDLTGALGVRLSQRAARWRGVEL